MERLSILSDKIYNRVAGRGVFSIALGDRCAKNEVYVTTYTGRR